jgi:hypothetical protein
VVAPAQHHAPIDLEAPIADEVLMGARWTHSIYTYQYARPRFGVKKRLVLGKMRGRYVRVWRNTDPGKPTSNRDCGLFVRCVAAATPDFQLRRTCERMSASRIWGRLSHCCGKMLLLT